MNEIKIQAEYDRLLQYGRGRDVNPDMMIQLSAWQKGAWKSYLYDVLDRIPITLSDKIVVDLGCKYGLLCPLLFERGVKRAIGIEDLDRFLGAARDLFKEEAAKVEFVKAEQGYIPLQPDMADLVIVNEVISHINPIYLPIIYSEIARLLIPGGMLFISDGNNLGHAAYAQERLHPLYEALENGPDGVRVDDLVVQVCFRNQRRQIIRTKCPDMAVEKMNYLAQNTAGLFGDHLQRVIDRFASTGELIRRPYREGCVPVDPNSGQVEEAGFYPEGIALDLMRYGFSCEILGRPSRPPSTIHRVVLNPSQMVHAPGYGGFAYQIPMPAEYPEKGAAVLLENEHALPFPLDDHATIAKMGSGRYSLWRANQSIYFSSTDNSDPRRNGRSYELYWMELTDDLVPAYPSPNFQIIAIKKQ